MTHFRQLYIYDAGNSRPVFYKQYTITIFVILARHLPYLILYLSNKTLSAIIIP
jgi:hypothetical protein